ncbi:DMT family transporter [Luteipulveratus flavus]|uniref:DMT family transporter n=1 Tax=Luteipulveratus flavus TaxID=3031728 RepID=A0ABT6C4X9_9MICO|nr:DMT family transporter [Luteipulveratus sp. YIM 133296]MDF8263984.1 DMT family transporter [Luteipulveratus sp. YIM 133296]
MTTSLMTPTDAPPRTPLAVLGGGLAMAAVGGSFAVSHVLHDAPLAVAQSLRYAVSALILLTLARASGHRVRAPRPRDWPWLVGTSLAGLVLFNIALVRGSAHAEPAALAVAMACVPVLLALGGPLTGGERPGPRVLAAAVVVTVGAVLIQGVGRTDATGVAWAGLVLLCEAGFTLLAVPVLQHHGAWGIPVHTTWMAALGFGGWSVVAEGPGAVMRLDRADLAAIAYLALVVTALAFVLWYSCVSTLGAGHAGLLTGVAPVAAAAVGTALGAGLPAAGVWAGTVVVATGLALGLSGRRTRRSPADGARRDRPPRRVA